MASYKLSAGSVKKIAETVRWAGAQPRNKIPGTHIRHNQIYYAKITAKTAINGLIRWKYTIELGSWWFGSSPTTGGTWTSDPTGGTIYAFNSAEDMNTFGSGSAAIGTGNTVAQSTGVVNSGSCTLLPLPVGCFVPVMYRGMDPGTLQSYYTILSNPNSAQ